MEDIILTQNHNEDPENELKIHLPRVISHTISHAMTEIVPALESVICLHNIPIPVHDFVVRAQLVARELTAKTSALAEMFGEPDFVSLPKMASFDIEPFFEGFTEHLNLTLADKVHSKISFVLDQDSEPDVIFDSRRVATILYHLISNSIQHGRTENKNVKLFCKSTSDYFELIVRDYGGGIPKEMQPMLLNKFQMEYNIHQDMNGLLPPRIQGLGLLLCRKLTQDMGGELKFKNYRSGAQFTLTIPQETRGMREPSEFTPDDALLHSCMSSLWLYLDDKKEGLVP